jgi:hypothetical protein
MMVSILFIYYCVLSILILTLLSYLQDSNNGELDNVLLFGDETFAPFDFDFPGINWKTHRYCHTTTITRDEFTKPPEVIHQIQWLGHRATHPLPDLRAIFREHDYDIDEVTHVYVVAGGHNLRYLKDHPGKKAYDFVRDWIYPCLEMVSDQFFNAIVEWVGCGRSKNPKINEMARQISECALHYELHPFWTEHFSCNDIFDSIHPAHHLSDHYGHLNKRGVTNIRPKLIKLIDERV